MDAAVRTGSRTRRIRRRWVVAAMIVVAIIAAGWFGLIGYLFSDTLMHGDGVAHGCPTPSDYGWAYEAVNYDITLDQRLPVDNPKYKEVCPYPGSGTAGDDVVSADGVRLAAWYIPAGNGAGPASPTVVIVHGWGVSKSDALRYAVPIHDRWNLLLVDTRHEGRSSGDWVSFGVAEVNDVRAMLDWLVAAKHPSAIATLGDSGGAAATITLARTDPRIRALVIESPSARMAYGIEARARGNPLTTPTQVTLPVAFAEFWLRTGGVWLGDADPIDAIGDLGSRPLAISYGTADATDVPEKNALALYDAALRAGVPAEIHACQGAGHGAVMPRCSGDWATWLPAFLERSVGSASIPPGAQVVHVTVTPAAVRIEPPTAHPGRVFLAISGSGGAELLFIGGSEGPGARQPLGLTDEHLAAVLNGDPFHTYQISGIGGEAEFELSAGKYVLLPMGVAEFAPGGTGPLPAGAVAVLAVAP